MSKEWKTFKIKEIADLSTGFAFKSKEYDLSGKLKVIRGKNITEGYLRWGDDSRYWNNSVVNLEKYIVDLEDIVIGMDGSKIGKNKAIVRESDIPVILAQRVGRIQAKKEISYQKFLWQLINNINFENYIENIKTGTSIPHISLWQIGNYEVQIPPLPEQKAIASILSAIDDKIENNHAINKTLEEMASALYKHWFVDSIKDDWKVYQLKELIDIKGGFSYKGKFIGDGDSLLLGMGCVSFKERFLDSGARLYSGECKPTHYVEPGDIVLATRQQSDNLPILGQPAMIPHLFRDRKVIVGANLYKVTNKSKMSNNLLFQILRSKEYREHILSNSSGTTVKMITKDVVELFELALPPNHLITRYDEYLSRFCENIEYNSFENKTLTQFRDTLIPKLISGEVRLKEFREKVEEIMN